MSGLKIYNALVKEFSLISHHSELNTTWHAKLENLAGFLVSVYNHNEYVSIATDVWMKSSNDENDLYFFGAENYYDIESARKQIMYLLEKVKELKIKLKKEAIEKDFKK